MNTLAASQLRDVYETPSVNSPQNEFHHRPEGDSEINREIDSIDQQIQAFKKNNIVSSMSQRSSFVSKIPRFKGIRGNSIASKKSEDLQTLH